LNLTPRPQRIGTENETGVDIRKQTRLAYKMVKSPAQFWKAQLETWGSKYIFNEIPVMEVTVEAQYKNKFGRVVKREREPLNIKLSHVPDNSLWSRGSDDKAYTLRLPGFWTGKRWVFNHYAVWLVTENEFNFPLIFNSRRPWYWPFGEAVEAVDVIESHLHDVGRDFHLGLHLRRRNIFAPPISGVRPDSPEKSEIELARHTDTLLSTPNHSLLVLFEAYLNSADSTGTSTRDKYLIDALVDAREKISLGANHLACANHDLAGMCAKLRSAEKKLSAYSDVLYARDRWAWGFMRTLLYRLEATKKISKRKEFGDIRRFTEEKRAEYIAEGNRFNSRLISAGSDPTTVPGQGVDPMALEYTAAGIAPRNVT